MRISCHKDDGMHDNGIELQWSTPQANIDMIAMVPKSFQQVVLISHENMGVRQKRAYNQIEAELIRRLKADMQAIARKNGDEFKVTITLDDNNAYDVEVTETTEGHMFLHGHGSTVTLAIHAAIRNVRSALEAWSYADIKKGACIHEPV